MSQLSTWHVLLRFGIRRVDGLILESLTARPSCVEQVSCSDNRLSNDYRCAEAEEEIKCEETTGNRNVQQICPSEGCQKALFSAETRAWCYISVQLIDGMDIKDHSREALNFYSQPKTGLLHLHRLKRSSDSNCHQPWFFWLLVFRNIFIHGLWTSSEFAFEFKIPAVTNLHFLYLLCCLKLVYIKKYIYIGCGTYINIHRLSINICWGEKKVHENLIFL